MLAKKICPFLIAVATLLTTLQANPAEAGVNTWTPIGPEGGDVLSLLAVATTPPTLYAGTVSGGVFRSTDSGTTWAPSNRGLEAFSVTIVIDDPQNPTTLYAATREAGVFRSTDSGASWQPRRDGLGEEAFIPALAIDPTQPALLYAGTSTGVFRSSDRGATWQARGDGLPATPARAIAIDPLTPSTLYAGTDAGVYKSTDSGGVWTPKTSDGPATSSIARVAIDHRQPLTVYAVVSLGPTTGGVFKSTDGGNTWNQLFFAGSRFTLDLLIDPDDADTLYAATSSNSSVLRSTDGGASWTSESQGITSFAVQTLARDPQNASTLYAGTLFGGGIFRSNDRGDTWVAANRGLTNLTVLALLNDATAPTRLYAGTSNGLFLSTDRGTTWAERSNGLEGFFSFTIQVESLVIDPSSPETLYAGVSSSDLGVFKSTDAGESWQLALDLDGSVEDLAIDRRQPSTLYAGTAVGVFRSTDSGTSWTAASSGLPSSLVVGLAVDPQTSGTLYASTVNFSGRGRLSKSSDGGVSWQAADNGLPGGFLLDIAVDPDTPSNVYVAGLDGVFKSLDGGATWQPAGDLPSTVGISLTIDPLRPATVYAATLAGVFRSNDGGATWRPTPSLLPQPALDLILDPDDLSRLYAGTQGGGVFEMQQSAAACVPGPNTLCIDDEPGDQRFQVELSFATVQGGGLAGDAIAEPLAPLGIARGGILSFADTSNPEVLVKILDGCGFNDRYWVFFAATTNVGFELTVTDTLSGHRQVYTNPDLETAETITDTNAFATCPTTSGEATRPDLGPPAAVPARAVSATKGIAGACVPGASTLCIDDQPGDRRFRISATFDTTLGGGLAGAAEAVALAPLDIDRGGILSFFDPTNPEVLIKVIDGCDFNGHFWVFYAATTTAGFQLDVEDTQTGADAIYINPDLQAAEPITDTAAFGCE